ncbi:MAG: methyltransferase type 11 [Bacteroidetes bacterium]|nr:methyltransferase type 11 [Bacteroidota bacterium]
MDLVEASARGYDQAIRHPWELARLHVIKKIISKYLLISNDSIILDIGCGDSFVSENLAKEYETSMIYAMDIAFTDEIINNFNQRFNYKNLRLYSSQDELKNNINKPVTVVLLTDVIEHIKDDVEFLNRLLKQNFIDDKTVFLITVPAYQSLFCSHDNFLGHYRRYTNKVLMQNTDAAGLTTIENGYFFFTLLPFRLFQVIKENIFNLKKKESSTDLATWKGGLFQAEFLKFILICDAEFSFFLKKLGIKLCGLSNYSLCRKHV